MSNVVGTPADEVAIGQRVEVQWEDFDELSLPYFRVIDAGRA
jgi:hypothetical protein